MTDKEYIANIKNVSSKELIDDLIYYGVDNYYYDLWKATLKEVARRLGIKVESI